MRVLVVDDHALFRAGLRHVLERHFAGCTIIEAGTSRDAASAIEAGEFELVLLDLDLPDRNGLDLLRDLHAIRPRLPVLVLSGYSEDEYGLRVLKAGAAGFLAKSGGTEELIAAVRKVSEGKRYVSGTLAEKLAADLQAGAPLHPHEALSEREFEVLVALAAGQPVSVIARRLTLSVKTVSTYRSRILQKMDCHSTAALIRYALQHNLTR